jgi:hypothetical protein
MGQLFLRTFKLNTTMLQVSSRVQFQMVSLELIPGHNRFGRTMALGSTQPLTEMSTRNISWGVNAAGADNLTTFMCRLSRNLGASTSWTPQGLSRPVMGLLYLFTIYMKTIFVHQFSDDLRKLRFSVYKSLSWPDYDKRVR